MCFKMLKDIKNPTITILGAAYKANVDDWRETPALKIIELAKNKKWKVNVHDPLLKDFPYEMEKDFIKATQNSDCLLILADHSFYQTVKPLEIKIMKNKNIFDSRNSIDETRWKEAGFTVKILGK